jgi:transcriptional regulator with XRE-family HTH domain
MADRNLRQRVGSRVLKRRENMRLTALELAARAGVHRNTISRIECGQSLSIETLWRLCKVLQISLDSLIEDRPAILGPVQLEFRFERKYAKRLQSNSNRRSDDVRSLQSNLGLQRSGTATMQPKSESLQQMRRSVACD